jgi:hypothetical protein
MRARRSDERRSVVIDQVSHETVGIWSWSGVPQSGGTRQIAGDLLEFVLDRIRYGTMPILTPAGAP